MLPIRKINYGDLDAVLRGYGFARRAVNGHVFYEDAAKEAFIALPNLPNEEPVRPHHYVTARVTVECHGIARAEEFERTMREHGDLPAGIRTVV